MEGVTLLFISLIFVFVEGFKEVDRSILIVRYEMNAYFYGKICTGWLLESNEVVASSNCFKNTSNLLGVVGIKRSNEIAKEIRLFRYIIGFDDYVILVPGRPFIQQSTNQKASQETPSSCTIFQYTYYENVEEETHETPNNSGYLKCGDNLAGIISGSTTKITLFFNVVDGNNKSICSRYSRCKDSRRYKKKITGFELKSFHDFVIHNFAKQIKVCERSENVSLNVSNYVNSRHIVVFNSDVERVEHCFQLFVRPRLFKSLRSKNNSARVKRLVSNKPHSADSHISEANLKTSPLSNISATIITDKLTPPGENLSFSLPQPISESTKLFHNKAKISQSSSRSPNSGEPDIMIETSGNYANNTDSNENHREYIQAGVVSNANINISIKTKTNADDTETEKKNRFSVSSRSTTTIGEYNVSDSYPTSNTTWGNIAMESGTDFVTDRVSVNADTKNTLTFVQQNTNRHISGDSRPMTTLDIPLSINKVVTTDVKDTSTFTKQQTDEPIAEYLREIPILNITRINIQESTPSTLENNSFTPTEKTDILEYIHLTNENGSFSNTEKTDIPENTHLTHGNDSFSHTEKIDEELTPLLNDEARKMGQDNEKFDKRQIDGKEFSVKNESETAFAKSNLATIITFFIIIIYLF